MRIDDINVDGFGQFHGARLRAGAGLTVIRGPNEAGKTTFLAFIRAMLFGFEADATRRSTAVGAVAGSTWRCTTVGRSASSATARRAAAAGSRSWTSTTRELGGHPRHAPPGRGAEGLPQHLRLRAARSSPSSGGSPTRRSRPASTAPGWDRERLRARRGGGLRQREASSSRAGRTPRSTRSSASWRSSTNTCASWISPRAMTPPYGTLRSATSGSPSLRDALAASGDERRRTERLRDAWEPWLDMSGAEVARAALGEVQILPPDLAEQVAVLRLAPMGVTPHSKMCRPRRIEQEIALGRIHVDDAVAACRDEIEELSRAAERDRARESSSRSVEDQLHVAEREREDVLLRLGSGWTAERVATFDDSVTVQAEITGRFRISSTARPLPCRWRGTQAGAIHDLYTATSELSRVVQEVEEIATVEATEPAIDEQEHTVIALEAALADRSRAATRAEATAEEARTAADGSGANDRRCRRGPARRSLAAGGASRRAPGRDTAGFAARGLRARAGAGRTRRAAPVAGPGRDRRGLRGGGGDRAHPGWKCADRGTDRRSGDARGWPGVVPRAVAGRGGGEGASRGTLGGLGGGRPPL